MMPLGHIGIPLLVPIFGKDLSLDVRLLILGALLPDIIDKPLGHLILSIDNGRIIGHSIVFASILLLSGIAYRRILPASLGVSIHQILDGMFIDREAALWPLLGPFSSYDFEVGQWIDAFTKPFVIGEEVIGLMLIVTFVIKFSLYRRKDLSRFLRKGLVRSQQNHLYKKHMK